MLCRYQNNFCLLYEAYSYSVVLFIYFIPVDGEF